MTKLSAQRRRALSRNERPSLPTPRILESRSGWVGLLLGFAAATAGVEPVLGPVRPWHLFVLFALAAAMLARGAGRARVQPVDLALFAYVAVRFITELVNSTELRYSINWDSLIYPVWWWLASVAARRVATDTAQVVTLLRGITVPLLISVPLAVGQALGAGPVLEFTAEYVTSEGFQARVANVSQLRAVGLVGHWTHWGVYCATQITVGFILLVLARRHRFGGGAYPIVVIVTGLLGLASSLTFAPAFIVAVVAIVAFRRIGLSVPIVVAMSVGLLAIAAFLGAAIEERIAFQATGSSRIPWVPDWLPSTISYRLYVWTSETIPMAQDRIVTGWGLNVYDGVMLSGADPHRTYPSQMQWSSPESQWLGELMASGLLGLASLLLVIVAMLRLVYRVRQQPAADVAALVGALVLSLSIAAATAPLLTNKGAPLVLWTLIGVVIGLQESLRRSAKETSADVSSTRSRLRRASR